MIGEHHEIEVARARQRDDLIDGGVGVAALVVVDMQIALVQRAPLASTTGEKGARARGVDVAASRKVRSAV